MELDAFKGQMTTPVTGESHKICSCADQYEPTYFMPLDLTLNRSAKDFIKRKFTEWYSLWYKSPSSWTVGEAVMRLKSSPCSQHLNHSMLVVF